MWAELCFVLSQFTCLTDRLTRMRRLRLRSCSTVKNTSDENLDIHVNLLLLFLLHVVNVSFVYVNYNCMKTDTVRIHCKFWWRRWSTVGLVKIQHELVVLVQCAGKQSTCRHCVVSIRLLACWQPVHEKRRSATSRRLRNVWLMSWWMQRRFVHSICLCLVEL